jgi:hypothetical protein
MTDPQQFLIYQSEDGATRIDVMLEAETLWLSQKQLTELFGKAKGTISEHIKHIFDDGELTLAATVRLYRTVRTEGGREVSREVEHYNLDMVLALGFRVRSPVAVRFRQWANDKLKEYLVKGFVMDDERLKNPGKGRDYCDELTRSGPAMKVTNFAMPHANPCITLLSCSCTLNWLKRGRNLSQSMMWLSSSGPSTQACLRTILPAIVTGTMQAPHMPVASTMMEFRLATVLTP